MARSSVVEKKQEDVCDTQASQEIVQMARDYKNGMSIKAMIKKYHYGESTLTSSSP